MITVFYDGKCGLCLREISYYRRVAPSDIFEWTDITIDASQLEQIGIGYADALKRLHARDARGKVHIGVDAFVLIWQQIPRWRLLASIVASPLIRPFARIVYRTFAAWRFNRLSHCRIAREVDGIVKQQKELP